MYKPTIGLEIHVELKTKSKMFCGCKNDPHSSEPNIHICPVCLAHPGTLPVANRTAIESVIILGVAVGGAIATYSEFDRKNYFYPDIPKAYQISQYAHPFVSGGEMAGVALTRVHLEEDTARSQHDKGAQSLVDFNRAGVPLMELVTEPVIITAKSAVIFARELQLVLRTLKISDANMEKGEMRVEANISVSDNDILGTKVEVKNLNSFKSVEAAISFEIERQIHILEGGGNVKQETCGWDEINQKTYSQRSKETAKDYRYFPDPDLPKMKIDEIPDWQASRLDEKILEMPEKKRARYSTIGLTSEQIESIIQTAILDEYFKELFDLADGNDEILTLAGNYLLTDLAPAISEVQSNLLMLSPRHFYDLIELVLQKKITSRVAKDMIKKYACNDSDLQKIVKTEGLLSNFDDTKLLDIVKIVVADNTTVVAEYKAGKVAVLQFLLGQAMKETRGAADPTVLKTLFESELS